MIQQQHSIQGSRTIYMEGGVMLGWGGHQQDDLCEVRVRGGEGFSNTTWWTIYPGQQDDLCEVRVT